MSGFKPNMWKFKKATIPAPTSLPSKNKFWVDVGEEENEVTSETEETGIDNDIQNPTNTDGEAKRKPLNLAVICYLCRQPGHPVKLCPMTAKVNEQEDASELINEAAIEKKSVRCFICKTVGHTALSCPLHPANKKPDDFQLNEKPISIEELVREHKCTYCGVKGHYIQACPVKKWSAAPEASERESEPKKGSSTKNPVETKSTKEINADIQKKIDQINRQKKLAQLLQMSKSQKSQEVKPNNLPIPKQDFPRPTYPAGIPRSFIDQNLPRYSFPHRVQPIEANTPPPNQPSTSGQQPTPAWPQQPSPTVGQHSPTVLAPTQINDVMVDVPQAYSPSDVYGDLKNESGSTEHDAAHDGSESPDPHGQKRLSAFQRLGPATEKKAKLTINLMCNKGEAVREVVDETVDTTPVHLRQDVVTSTDETVMKYLYFWPWKKPVSVRRTATFKTSKSAMLLEQEQMEESYDRDNAFIQISVTNYPKNWTKEQVFDVFLGHFSVIPCFIEFTPKVCKFLVVRSKPALLAIHKMGFKVRHDDVELVISISLISLTQNNIDFVPRLILRKRLVMQYDGVVKLDLHEFTLQSDVSHFIYFPLRSIFNQMDVVQLQSVVEWDRLTELNLSHNRLTSIDGFQLGVNTPRVKILDLSHNYLDKVTALLRCRNLPLNSLSLEGNPLCHDYTDPAEYVKVVRMIFPSVRMIDGVKLHLKGDMPTFQKNYGIYGSSGIVEKFLDTFFPLLEAPPIDRQRILDMYDENSLMTVIYRYKFIHRLFRISSISSHFVDDGVKDIVDGATSITKYINKWPAFKHDPFTFTVDVLLHDDSTTIVKICGILKLTAESLAEDEHILTFSRTTLLHTSDGVEYKILNELLIWDEPSNECKENAFQITKIRSKKLYVDLEFVSNPDEESKEKLTAIFSHLTELDKNHSRRCLEKKNWNLRTALDNYIQLLKLNDWSAITGNESSFQPYVQEFPSAVAPLPM